MGKVIKLALMGTAVALFAWGCSKEKPETDPQPQTAPEAPADSTLNLDALVADTNAKRLLAQVAEILVNENRFIVTVEGHTDARGTEDYNISLGARRSTVVREFLIAYGVDANRLVSVSYGKERPKVQGTDETAYSKNRRAHFRVSIDQ